MYFVWIREAPKPSWDVSLFMSVGQDQAWWGGPRVRHGPSMGLPQQRSTCLPAIAHVAIPSSTFILRISQQTKSLGYWIKWVWIFQEHLTWLGCVVLDCMDSLCPLSCTCSRGEWTWVSQKKISYWSVKLLSRHPSLNWIMISTKCCILANKCLVSYTYLSNLNWVTIISPPQ